MRAEADKLWTRSHTTKLIEALLRNKVAIELNTLEQLPNQIFILQAKEADCKFGFGSANVGSDLKRCEFGLKMVETCKLNWSSFFAPGAWWPKSAERRWPAGVYI